MTVRELMEKLKGVDPNIPVRVLVEDYRDKDDYERDANAVFVLEEDSYYLSEKRHLYIADIDLDAWQPFELL